MSILLIIKLHTCINFVVCTAANTELDATYQACVCAADFYQTTEDPPVCTACPDGSTTNQNTNCQDITACGKYHLMFNYHFIKCFKMVTTILDKIVICSLQTTRQHTKPGIYTQFS